MATKQDEQEENLDLDELMQDLNETSQEPINEETEEINENFPEYTITGNESDNSEKSIN